MANSSQPTRTQLEVPTVAASLAVRAKDAVVIDLRSESEYADDHLPGAVSIPLFDDTGRAVVGTLFKQESPESAFRAGAEMVQAGIGDLLERIGEACNWKPAATEPSADVAALTGSGIEGLQSGIQGRELEAVPERAVILHCWRGGLRSQSVIGYCRSLGLERAVGITGGYKSYRRHVIDSTAAWKCPPAFVIRGLTGVGKTLILRELERIRPGWTFDLELHAGHRSSLLGMVGLEPCTQKTFESRLATRIREGFPGPCVFEGESRKVGDAIIPASIWTALRGGVNLEVTASLERRVQVLSEDYLACPTAREDLAVQLGVIEKRMQPSFELVSLLENDRIPELVEILLEHYYDPLYLHSEKGREYSASFHSSNESETAEEIASWIDSHVASS